MITGRLKLQINVKGWLHETSNYAYSGCSGFRITQKIKGRTSDGMKVLLLWNWLLIFWLCFSLIGNYILLINKNILLNRVKIFQDLVTKGILPSNLYNDLKRSIQELCCVWHYADKVRGRRWGTKCSPAEKVLIIP